MTKEISEAEQRRFLSAFRAMATATKAKNAILIPNKDISMIEELGFGVLEPEEEAWGHNDFDETF